MKQSDCARWERDSQRDKKGRGKGATVQGNGKKNEIKRREMEKRRWRHRMEFRDFYLLLWSAWGDRFPLGYPELNLRASTQNQNGKHLALFNRRCSVNIYWVNKWELRWSRDSSHVRWAMLEITNSLESRRLRRTWPVTSNISKAAIWNNDQIWYICA